MLGQLGTHSTASNILAQEHNLCYYHPTLVPYLDNNISATILLQRMIYWASRQNNHFYKFKEPCSHRLCREGDSWAEELGFSRRTFDSSMKIIGAKYNPAKNETVPDAYVLYYTDINRLTWYMVNWNKVNTLLEQAFHRKVQNALYVKCETYNTKSADRTLDNNVTINTNNQDSISITPTQTDNKISKTKNQFADDDFVKTASNELTESTLEEKIILLKHYGIPHIETQKIANKFNLEFIRYKLRIIENKFVKGTISNLQGYIIHVFQSEQKEISEYEKNINNKKQHLEQKRKQEEMKKKRQRQIEEEEQREFERKTDKLLAEATLNDYKNFKKWLAKENSLIYKKYLQEGTKSYIAEMFLRKYLYDTYYGQFDSQTTKDDKL